MQQPPHEIVLTPEILNVIRKVVSGLLPNAQNASLFSAATVNALSDRAGQKREKNVQADAETVRKHCVVLDQQMGLARASGYGIFEKGCPVGWTLSWNGDDITGNSLVAIDPQGLFAEETASLKFSVVGEDGPLSMAQRVILPVEGRSVRNRVRRLSGPDARALREEHTALRVRGTQSLLHKVSNDIRFFKALGHMASSVEGAGAWSVIKTGNGDDTRLMTSWAFEGSGFGFMDAPSAETLLVDNAEVRLSQGNMRVMSWVLDRLVVDGELSALETDGIANQCSAKIEMLDSSAVLDVYWARESNAQVSESQEAAFSRCQSVKTKIETANLNWSVPHPLNPLVEGLNMGVGLCPPIAGKEVQAGLCVSMDLEPEIPSYMVRSRNTEVTTAFRMGMLGDVTVDLAQKIYLTPYQAKSMARMLRTLSADFSVRNGEMVFETGQKNEPGIFMLRGTHGVTAGALFYRMPDMEALLLSDKAPDPMKTTPNCYVEAKELLDNWRLVYQMGMLPSLNHGKSRTLTDPCLIWVGADTRLRIELGSENHVVGGHLPINEKLMRKTDKTLMTLVKPEAVLSTLNLFDKVIAYIKGAPENTRYYFQIATGGGEGLYMALVQGRDRTTVARVRVSLTREPKDLDRNPMPYQRLSPLGRVKPNIFKLPELDKLATLSLLHTTFGLPVPEELVTPMRLSMTGMEYEPTENGSLFRATDTYRAVRWTEDSQLFGSRRRIFAPGFFQAAELLKSKRPLTGFSENESQMQLHTQDIYVAWEKALPADPETLFPTKMLELMLMQKLKEKEIDPATGLISGLGTPGRINALISKQMLKDRLGEILNDGIYGRVAWLWRRDGDNQILEEDTLGTSVGLPSPLAAEIVSWDTPNDRFFLCVSRRFLQASLGTIMTAEEGSGRDMGEDLRLCVSSAGVQMTGEDVTCVIMPMNLREKEQEYLSTLNTDE